VPLSQRAEAVPAFARQTGLACVACHVSFPELTPFGRFFKLTGYTLTNKKTIPLAAMLQFSQTNTRTIQQSVRFRT
jgi:lactam utilization protein B